MIVKDLELELPTQQEDHIEEAKSLGNLVSKHIDTLFITLGSLGLMVVRKAAANDKLLNPVNKTEAVHFRYYETKKVEKLVNVSGAGDCLASAIIAGMLNGYSESKCVSLGFAAANMALQSQSAVPDKLFRKNEKIWECDTSYIDIK